MFFWYIIPILLAFGLSSAHFFRNGYPDVALFCLFSFLLIFVKKPWMPFVVRVILLAFSLSWLLKAHEIYMVRSFHGSPWLRAVLILVVVLLFVRFCAELVLRPAFRERYGTVFSMAPFRTFVAVFLVLGLLRLKPGLPLTIHERFFPLFSWVGILFFALYAAFLTDIILQSTAVQKIRFRMWLGFSILFFAQFLAGLMFNPLFLMTGELHYPVPALVLFGPWIRGGGYFMLGLFILSVLLLGPAWCSYLCYIGAFDLAAAFRRKKIQLFSSAFIFKLRMGFFSLFIIMIMGLRFAGLAEGIIITIVAGFGIGGFIFFALYSFGTGRMFHCTAFCPLGYMALLLGKLNPFRITLNTDSCCSCGVCTAKCRYGALPAQAFLQGKPTFSCTLCGDCLSPCPENSLSYRFMRFSYENSRRIFLSLAVVLHTLFLATGRI